MYWIERRAGRSLFTFLMTDKNRYTSLEGYYSKKPEFTSIVAELIPHHWTMNYQGGVWCQAIAPNVNVPKSGFKIHLSSSFYDASAMLNAIVPVLVEKNVTFKFLVDKFSLSFMNSQQCNKGSSGKFITIYPTNQNEFYELIEALKLVTSEFSGPYILSDNRVEGSKVLFYRYGAFIGKNKLNIYGEKEPLMQMPNGEWIKDSRGSFYSLPEGIEDPLKKVEEPFDEVILNNRYKVLGFLADSNKGGVYKALDQITGNHVVIKEVRPFINENEDGTFNSTILLKNEEKALARLSETNLVPKIIEQFDEWDNSFLVIEMLPGTTLGAARANEKFALALKTSPSIDEVKFFYQQILSISETLLTSIKDIHDLGVLLIDISPQNIMFDEEANKLWFIDLEASKIQGDEGINAKIATVGFANIKNVVDGKITEAVDYEAIGNIIYNLIFPVNELFSLNPKAKKPLLETFMAEKGGNKEILDFVLNISSDKNKNDKLLAKAKASLNQDLLLGKSLEVALNDTKYIDFCEKLASTIVKNTQVNNKEFDYRPDYRAFSSGHLSFFHGISGILSVLHKINGELPDELESKFILDLKSLSQQSLAPGLASGSAGLAKLLWQIGLKNNAKTIMLNSKNSKLLSENADLFYGAAGWGLINLSFYSESLDQDFLSLALNAEAKIKDQIKSSSKGLYIEQTDETVFHSLGHGSAGVALFYLQLYKATNCKSHLQTGRELLQFEINHAKQQQGHFCWNRTPDLNVTTPYVQVGSAGIIQVLLRYYEETQDVEYLNYAEKAASYLKGKTSIATGILNGMSGLGEVFIDLYRITKKEEHLLEACRFAERIKQFALVKGEQISFAGEESFRFADDFGAGSSGVAWFFYRLTNLSQGAIYDF